MNILSWNVNGIRALHKKGLLKPLFTEGIHLNDRKKPIKLDLIGFQETKATYIELGGDFFPEGYTIYHNSAVERKGYSGTVIFVSNEIKSNIVEIPVSYETLRTEGRLVCVELDNYFIINCYFPNGGGQIHRLDYKKRFYDEFVSFCEYLQEKKTKKVVFFGDLNIAHHPIDLARPKENEKNVGFLPEEREKLDILHKKGFVDLFRAKYPETVIYSWWDMKTRSRDRNIGWRIDTFYGHKSLLTANFDVSVLDYIQGSDHCPVLCTLE